MSKLSTEEVLKLAKLARLRLSDAEIEKYTNELAGILDYVEMLSIVDTEGLKSTNQVTGLVNVFRSDEVQQYTASPEKLLDQTPQHQSGYIKVKRMI